MIYKGQDLASYVSGLKNGNYYFRIRTLDTAQRAAGQWSETATVIVNHHPLDLALWLAAVGGLVFLMTVGVVVYGTRKARQEEEAAR